MKHMKLYCLASLLLFFNLAPLIGRAQTFDDINEQADKEYLANNYQKAITLATQAINTKSNPRSYFIRADARYSTKDYQAALDDYNTALSDYSSYYSTDKYKGRLYYWRARCKQKLGNYTDAIDDFNSSVTYNFEDIGYTYWNRGNSYYSLGKYKQSDDDYAKAIDHMSEAKDLTDLYKYRGDCSGRLDDYAGADKFYTRAISYDANNYNAYWSRGYYRNLNSQTDDAIADYKKAISILEAANNNDNSHDLAVVYRNLALLYNGNDKTDDALEAINKSLKADPNYVDAFETRADIYTKQKNYTKAKSDYTNAIGVQTDKQAISDLYFDRSYKLDWVTLDYKTALEDLNKSIDLDSKDGMKYWHRAITYQYKKDYPKAMADVNKAIQVEGDNASSGLYTLRAALKESSGDIKGAISDYQAASKLDKSSASIYYNLGRLFKTKMKNDDLADINLTKAMEMAAKDEYSATGAYAKVVNGNSKDAISDVLQKVDKYRDDKYEYKWMLHNAACIYALSGNSQKALEYLDRSLAAGFDDYNHLVNDRDLVSLTALPQYRTILTKYKVPQPKW